MFSFFTLQATHARRGAYGQATVLLLTSLAAVLSLAFGVVYLSHLGAEKVASANAVDAIAISAATWEARGLNAIAALNEGILDCFRVIRWTSVLWGAMAVASLTGVGIPAFIEYSKQAVRIIRSSWETAQQLADWSEKIKDSIPYIVLAETATLSREMAVTGVLYPYDPRGPHDHVETLELHLTKSHPISLAEAIAPINKAKRKIRKWTPSKSIARKILRIIDSALQSIAGPGFALIRMLVPEDHFADRQKVQYSGFKAASRLPIPFFPASPGTRFFFQATAEPYGGTATKMSWKSRLTENRREK